MQVWHYNGKEIEIVQGAYHMRKLKMSRISPRQKFKQREKVVLKPWRRRWMSVMRCSVSERDEDASEIPPKYANDAD